MSFGAAALKKNFKSQNIVFAKSQFSEKLFNDFTHNLQ